MNYYKDGVRHRKYVANVIASDIENERRLKEKANNHYIFDRDVFDKGACWFNEGFCFEDAPEELKANKNFINGYELARRRDKINKSLEIQGALWFYSNKSLEEAHESVRNNVSFIKGYNEANNSKKRR